MYYLDVEGPIQHFETSVNSQIYVDKSILIEKVTIKERERLCGLLVQTKTKNDPAIILILKYGHSAKETIEQIKQ